MPSVRIAVLSDNRLFSEGLVRIIGAETSFIVVGHDEGPLLRPAPREPRPDILLVDSRMEGALGLCAALKRDAGPAVILVGAPDGDDWAQEALGAGARGILTRDAGAEHLVKAVRVVHEGEIWAPRRVMAACMEHLAGAPVKRRAGGTSPEQRLSRREREVFRQAATGIGNKELAERLAISEATVKVHLTRIFQKLGLRGRAELAAAYHGLIALDPQHASTAAERLPGMVVRLKA